MSSLNKVMLMGNVGRDPEIRTTQTGEKIAQLSIATTETWKDRGGERQERTEWHRVVVFNERAVSFIEQYVAKGARLYVEGQLQTRKWTDQKGVERYTTEIVVSKFRGEVMAVGSGGKPERDAAPSGSKTPAEMDDEIPF